jgi:hypothetical protein
MPTNQKLKAVMINFKSKTPTERLGLGFQGRTCHQQQVMTCHRAWKDVPARSMYSFHHHTSNRIIGDHHSATLDDLLRCNMELVGQNILVYKNSIFFWRPRVQILVSIAFPHSYLHQKAIFFEIFFWYTYLLIKIYPVVLFILIWDKKKISKKKKNQKNQFF